jgi:transposase InsO family protein
LTLETNAIAERVIGTLRRGSVDHLIPPDARHLRAVLAKDVDYDNRQRPHRTLGLVPPQPLPGHGTRAGPICSRPVRGGLHRGYERAA